jgi:acyl carrier protein
MVYMPNWPADFEQIVRARCARMEASSPLPAEVPLTALGVDSLGMLTLIVQLEETFEVMFPDEALAGDALLTPQSAWATVHGLLAEGGRGDG